jgi:hypothetical protein
MMNPTDKSRSSRRLEAAGLRLEPHAPCLTPQVSSFKSQACRGRGPEAAGVVLLDVLFAVFILGMVALPLVEARGNSIRRAAATHNLRIARMLAGKKMEEVLANEIATEPDQNFAMSGEFTEEGYYGFKYEIDELDVPIHDEEELAEDPDKREWYVRCLTVNLTYPGEGNERNTFSLTTILPEIVEEESGG